MANMQAKQIAKRILDVLMIVLLPILMAKMLTGQEVHEWLGVAITVCLLVHHILNISWLKTLFRGTYTPVRCLVTAVNLLLLADILTLASSGIIMSGFVFSWLNISGGILLARQLHLLASYWGLILMSAHTGIHVGMMQKTFRKLFRIQRDSALRTWVLRIITVCAAGYGVYAFIAQKIASYLFLRTHFLLFDESKPAVGFFLETIAIIVLFAEGLYYLQKILSKRKVQKATSLGLGIVAFAVPILACFAVVVGMNSRNVTTPSWGAKTTDSQTEQSDDDQRNPSDPIADAQLEQSDALFSNPSESISEPEQLDASLTDPSETTAQDGGCGRMAQNKRHHRLRSI